MAGSDPIAGSPRPIFNKLKIGLIQFLDLATSLRTFTGDMAGSLPEGYLKSISKGNSTTVVADPSNPYYTVQPNDFIVSIDCTSSPLTIYLPEISPNGSPVLIFKMKNGTNPCNIVCASKDTILTGNIIILNQTDTGILLFNDNVSQWVYFDSVVPGSTGNVISNSGTDKSIPRFDLDQYHIQDSEVTVDDVGNVYPKVNTTQDLGVSGTNEWLHVFAKVLQSMADLTLVSTNADLNVQISGTGSVNIKPGTSGALNIYDAAGIALMATFALVSSNHFLNIKDSLLQFQGTSGSIPNPATGNEYIYKKDSVANILYAMGEDLIEHRLVLEVDSNGDFLSNFGMGGFIITNHGTPSSGTDVTNKSYVDSVVAISKSYDGLFNKIFNGGF